MTRAAKHAEPTIDQKLASLRADLESLPAQELAGLIGRVRDAQSDRVMDAFGNAWKTIETAADEHFALTGRGLPVPAGLEDVFDNAPSLGLRRRARPDAWYTYEITNVIRLSGDDGATESFITDFISARGGDPRTATRRILPQLIETGFLAGSPEDGYRLANHRPDAWYDYAVLAFINDADADSLPTTMEIHNHIIAQGGHGAEVVTTVLPRLENAGRIRERSDGTWDSTSRRPDAWYDFTISSFVLHADPSNLPTTMQIHDHVIAQGGHGAIAVSDALPRLRESGHLVEIDDGIWDHARRRPAAWYDFTVMGLFYDSEGPLTTKQIHDHVIEQGGHGAEIVTDTLPRLTSASRITDLGDGTWDLASRKPRAWYDFAVIAFIRASDAASPPSFKQIHDHVISQGGHGASLATDVIPALIASGEITEIDDGVYDVANRRTDAWYDQTVLSMFDNAEGELTSMQIHDHVIAQGGHGAEVVQNTLPRLERAGLISGDGMGTWTEGIGVPSAYIEQQLFASIRAAAGDPVSMQTCLESLDEDLADASIAEPAFESLADAGLIERSENAEGEPLFSLPRPAKRQAAKTMPRRTRVRRAA